MANPARTTPWPAERTARLRALWEAGDLAPSAIAAKLGVSLPAAKSKATREGFVYACKAPQPSPPEPSSWKACQWIDGNKPWRFCGQPVVAGTPYCEQHAQRAYIRRLPARVLP